MGDRSIRAKTLGATFGGYTSALHSFALERATKHVLEIDDIHFHLDSAVLLPDNPPEDERTAPPAAGPPEPRVTSIAVLAHCLRTADANPTWRLLMTGHADTSGQDAYNVTLSEQRADASKAVLMGDRALFTRTCLLHSRTEDTQRILTWLARDWAWPCDPGGIDNRPGPLTNDAVRAFKRTYNADFSGSLPDNAVVDSATWGAFFDCYQRELREILNTDDAGLAALRGRVQFFDSAHDAVGCGENWPLESPARANFRSVADRRIELVFFEDRDLPHLDCHARRGACDARQCQVYDPRFFDEDVIPVEPVLPRVRRIPVHLALAWTDPDGTDHRFPGDMAIVVEYLGGAREDHRLTADGVLDFIADRARTSFTLRLEPGADRYLASAPTGSAQTPAERLLAEADAEAVARDHQFRIWKLPARSALVEATWACTDASYTSPTFALAAEIGTSATPAALVLDPRWQFVRLEYFDRRYGASDHGGRRIIPPPVLLAGSRTAPATGNGPADTRSNWQVGADQPATASQALPWVIQHGADGSADARPAPGTMLHLTTPAHTFVVARSATDRGLEVITDAARLGPSAARLGLYDLPEVWRARSYQARPGDGSAPVAFEALTQAQLDSSMQRAQPLAFCLDDLILRIDDTSTALMAPGGGAAGPRFPSWNPATMQIAVFSNTLLNGPNPQDVGPFQPNTAANASYQSQHTGRLAAAGNIVYVSDYPDWTRAVIYEGDVFEAFDQRAPVGSDAPNQVVGARLAICHTISSTLTPPGSAATRPAVSRGGDHFVAQPFFRQEHDTWWTRQTTDARDTGRCDLALLRCCGVEADGVTESARLLTYFRFFVNFNPTFTPDFNTSFAPLGLAGAAAATWIDTAIRNIPRRWTGPDGAYNAGPVTIGQAGGTLLTRSVWFCQHVRRPIAHYELGVFRPGTVAAPDIRAYMGSDTGIGVLGDPGVLHQPDNAAGADGWFTSAHESGHGSSLGDEYIENSAPIGFLGGFDSYSPGSPFGQDGRAMMNTNKEVRARYFWHLAEWLRALYGGEFEVRHGAFTYALPHHAQAPLRSHINWPLAETLDATLGSHGKFDAYFYPLGRDDYSVNVLPRAVRPGVAPFDGLIIIYVKLEFAFHINVQATIDASLKGIDQQLRFRFNNRWMASCTIGGRRYDRCLIAFEPRYWANNYTLKAPRDTQHHFLVETQAEAPDWDHTIFGWGDAAHHLHWQITQSAYVFSTYFEEMLGLTRGVAHAAADFEPIVRKVAPGASVSAV